MLLEIKNLNKHYDHNKGVFGFNISVEPGSITLLLGPNGAGKTTAMKSILHLIQSDYQSFLYQGQAFDRKYALRSMGAMISKPVFYEYLTGLEHLQMMKAYYDITDGQIHEVLRKVGLVDSQNKKVNTYSTGMKQRLDFARAILHEPQLLILDEPFSGLDIEVKYALKQLISELRNQGTSIIISSHMVGEIESLADQLMILYEGHTLYQGPIKTQSNLEHFYLETIASYQKGAQDETLKSRMA